MPEPSQNETFARALLDHLQDSVILMDAENRIRFVTPSYEALLGYAPGELLGSRAGERVHPEDREALQGKIHEVWDSKGHAAYDHRLMAKDGSLRYVRASGSYLRDGAPWCPGPCLLASVHDVSHEKEALQRLETSERFHRALIENLQDGFLLLDMELRPRYVSPGYARSFGVQSDQVLGQEASARIHPEDLAKARHAFDEAVALGEGGKPPLVELRLVDPDGTVRATQSSLSYLPQGMPGYPGPSVLVVARNVTEQRATRLALEASERFQRALVENLHDAVIIGAADGRIVYVSAAYERLTGWTPQDMLGTSPRERTHPDDADRFRQALQGVLQSGRSSQPEQFRTFTKDGRQLEVLIQLRLLPDGMPGIAGPLILGAVRDRSAEAAAERALAESERFFRALIDNLQDGILVLDLDRRTLFVSPAYARLADRSPESFAHQTPRDRIYAEDLPRAEAFFSETAAEPDKGKVIEYRLKRPDGSLHWIRSASRYLAEGIPGHPEPCILIVARDVQAERQSEQELRRFERLALLGEMTAGLAHELRNPLMAISATAELLRGSAKLDGDELQDVDTILVQARRLRELLDQTLSKRKMQEPQAVPAENALRVAAGLARRSFGPAAERVAQSFDIAADAPAAWGEPGPLQQVLLNLILNALQAMPQGGRLGLKAGRQDAGVLFSIVDDGPGVPAEALANIFDPFFTTKSYGSGLGLSVSRRIVEGHGGKLWAERLEKGMAFHAWIPGPPQA